MNMSPYPLQLSGDLAPKLSRGLWLVKWLLAIPHFIVLFFLWIAFVVDDHADAHLERGYPSSVALRLRVH